MHQADRWSGHCSSRWCCCITIEVRERVRQGNQLVGLCRRHGVFVKAASLLDDEEWRRCLNHLPIDSLLRSGWEYVREFYQMLTLREWRCIAA